MVYLSHLEVINFSLLILLSKCKKAVKAKGRTTMKKVTLRELVADKIVFAALITLYYWM